MNKLIFTFLFLLLIGFGIAASTTSQASFCCEKTTAGAWCVNAPENECDASYSAAPTSCETTGYCRLGTCYESDEGICMENTPQRVCVDNGGTWDEREIEEVPQCQLGCCVIADQAAFVPLVRCKKLSSLFGVENDYRTDIKSEVECIAEAQSQDVGACVYEKDFERVCEFTTRGDCGAGHDVETINETSQLSSDKTFYKDFLCSAEELNTACAKQTSTTCYKGDVYWLDSCGNRENVYSNNKVKSWNNGKVLDADGVCSSNDGSDIDCGNCDYLLGTRCAAWDSYLGGPASGDNYCQRTECEDRNGNPRINGESWCVRDKGYGDGLDKVGSRYFREVCVDGQIKVEPCADYRNEICLDGSIELEGEDDFETAACRVNRWQDCTAQIEEEDCADIDRRDCIWLPSVAGIMIGSEAQNKEKTTGYSNPTTENTFTNPTSTSITGNAVSGEESQPSTTSNRASGVCVPNFPPGLKFWEESTATQICGQASAKCIVVYEEGLFDKKKVVSGQECLEEQWAANANRICMGLGDCGGSTNYNENYNDDGYEWIEDGTERKLSNTQSLVRAGFTGRVIYLVDKFLEQN